MCTCVRACVRVCTCLFLFAHRQSLCWLISWSSRKAPCHPCSPLDPAILRLRHRTSTTRGRRGRRNAEPQLATVGGHSISINSYNYRYGLYNYLVVCGALSRMVKVEEEVFLCAAHAKEAATKTSSLSGSGVAQLFSRLYNPKRLVIACTSDLIQKCTVNFGHIDIGYNDISFITTMISCQELFSIYCHTKSFGYNDIVNNDTSQITTHISRPKALNHCEYNDKHSSLTGLASPSKEIARHIMSVDSYDRAEKAYDKAWAREKHASVVRQHTLQPHVCWEMTLYMCTKVWYVMSRM